MVKHQKQDGAKIGHRSSFLPLCHTLSFPPDTVNDAGWKRRPSTKHRLHARAVDTFQRWSALPTSLSRRSRSRSRSRCLSLSLFLSSWRVRMAKHADSDATLTPISRLFTGDTARQDGGQPVSKFDGCECE